MRASSLPIVLLAVLGMFSLGASCNRQDSSSSAGQVQQSAESSRIEKLEQVDTSELTAAEKRAWADVVNDALSPCGEPVSVARCVAEGRSCGGCVPAARYVARLVAEGFEKTEIKELFSTRFDPKKKVTIQTADSPVRGAPMAKLTIVEFSDFECPYCGAAHPELSSLLSKFEGQVNLVFKHFPLEGHKHALLAARAAVAAQAQGKFWDMADVLFEHQRELSADKINQLAKELGLDMAQFEKDLTAPSTLARVEADKKEGQGLGIQGTPSLFVDGRPYKEPIQNLTKYIEEELDR